MSSKPPNDANDDAIRRLIKDGSDLYEPMRVDFQVAVPSEKAAQQMANAASKLGYKVHVYASPECALAWTCECSTEMLVTREAIVAKETELAQLASPLGGFPDGWVASETNPVLNQRKHRTRIGALAHFERGNGPRLAEPLARMTCGRYCRHMIGSRHAWGDPKAIVAHPRSVCYRAAPEKQVLINYK